MAGAWKCSCGIILIEAFTGLQLDSMILKGFSNLNDSMIGVPAPTLGLKQGQACRNHLLFFQIMLSSLPFCLAF